MCEDDAFRRIGKQVTRGSVCDIVIYMECGDSVPDRGADKSESGLLFPRNAEHGIG